MLRRKSGQQQRMSFAIIEELVPADRLLRKKDDDPSPTKTIQQSPVDPDSGQLHKEGKPDGFHYSEHRTVDSKRNIVTNVHVTAANVNDVEPIPEILAGLYRRLGYLPEVMGLDAEYHSAISCKQLNEANILSSDSHRLIVALDTPSSLASAP